MVEVLMYFGIGFFVGVAACAKILSTIYDSESTPVFLEFES